MPPIAPKKKKGNPKSPYSPRDELHLLEMTSESDSSTKNLITKIKMKNRTLGDLCNQIKTIENTEKREKLEEFNSSDQAEDIGDSGSEDDPVLLKL